MSHHDGIPPFEAARMIAADMYRRAIRPIAEPVDSTLPDVQTRVAATVLGFPSGVWFEVENAYDYCAAHGVTRDRLAIAHVLDTLFAEGRLIRGSNPRHYAVKAGAL